VQVLDRGIFIFDFFWAEMSVENFNQSLVRYAFHALLKINTSTATKTTAIHHRKVSKRGSSFAKNSSGTKLRISKIRPAIR